MPKKTQYYQLNQYDPGDSFLRTDFNGDNAKIDAALKALDDKAETKADQAALDQTNAAVAQLSAEKCEAVLGSYVGNGAASRTIDLGFPPKAAYLCSQGGLTGAMYGSFYIYGGLALPGKPLVMENGSDVAMELTATGFKLTHDGYRRVNNQGLNYYYIALR